MARFSLADKAMAAYLEYLNLLLWYIYIILKFEV